MARSLVREQIELLKRKEVNVGFTNIDLLKTEVLGAGSYGTVCKAKCDELLCAAKRLHSFINVSLQAMEVGRRHPSNRFETELVLLKGMNHPNVVQYLGTYQDPEDNSTYILMELMDESLTHFLESSKSISFPTQVNISYDIAQALVFLHSNKVIHRDLSGNNILLLAGRAKVTDFGMSYFTDPTLTHQYSLTMAPGTPAYMPPEALKEPPQYTDQIDIFSFGVLIIQILTCCFPDPSDRFVTRTLLDPNSPDQPIQAQVLVPEATRRQNHIALIDSSNPLLLITLRCIQDIDTNRPTSKQLCLEIRALKSTSKYSEHLQNQLDSQTVTENSTTTNMAGHSLQGEFLEAKIMKLSQELQESQDLTATLLSTIAEREQEISELKQRKQVNHHNHALEIPEPLLHRNHISVETNFVPDSLVNVDAGSCTSNGSVAYFRPLGSRIVYSYDSAASQWQILPQHPFNSFTIVCVGQTLVSVGGSPMSSYNFRSKKVLSYVNGSWVQDLPPMRISRESPVAVYSQGHLVVMSHNYIQVLNPVVDTGIEILNVENRSWSVVCTLPFKLLNVFATVCGDYLYLLAMDVKTRSNHALRCSLQMLLASTPKSKGKVWESICTPNWYHSSLAILNHQIVAIGGQNKAKGKTSDILAYNDSSNTWSFVGKLSNPRSHCLTTVLGDKKLIVVGGSDQKCCEVIQHL